MAKMVKTRFVLWLEARANWHLDKARRAWRLGPGAAGMGQYHARLPAVMADGVDSVLRGHRDDMRFISRLATLTISIARLAARLEGRDGCAVANDERREQARRIKGLWQHKFYPQHA